MHVNFVDCEGHETCANSTMTIEYPKNSFLLECDDFLIFIYFIHL